MVIAQAARDRRASGKILRDERTHHVFFEAVLLVDDVIRNAKRLGHAACIVNVVDGAAAPLHGLGHALVTSQSALVPQLKRESDDVVALLAQQCGDGGGVHSSRHGHGDGVILTTLHYPSAGPTSTPAGPTVSTRLSGMKKSQYSSRSPGTSR